MTIQKEAEIDYLIIDEELTHGRVVVTIERHGQAGADLAVEVRDEAADVTTSALHAKLHHNASCVL